MIMTWRDAGELIDRQIDLTSLIGGSKFVGDASAAMAPSGVVQVFGRDSRGGVSVYCFDPLKQTWSFQQLNQPDVASGSLAADPIAAVDSQGAIYAFVTTGTGHLLEYSTHSSQALDLSELPGWGSAGPVYATVGSTVYGSNLFLYATNQRGGLVQVTLALSGQLSWAHLLLIPGGRDTMVFQDVCAVTVGSLQHVFAGDGASRLVHIVVDSNGNVVLAENVTKLGETGQASVAGYSAYQLPFAGRAYGDFSSAIDPTNNDIYVEGTNGRDLIEYHL